LPFLSPELEQYRHRVQKMRKFTYDSACKICTKNVCKTVLQGSGRMRSGAQEINGKLIKNHRYAARERGLVSGWNSPKTRAYDGKCSAPKQHMIGWPTMMTLAQREAGRRERELARAAARALGAEN
jgi:hypothetical protein